ncbi:hypothetical protein BDN67DRAFT_1010802 [Paxillus ammoniavirescens]|nr:hypothetical protein BDN67DRAFT_1010802 [Paxillus ammoniavirescens]
MGDAASSVNRDSKRVEATPLAEDEDGQHRNATHSPLQPATTPWKTQDETYERQQSTRVPAYAPGQMVVSTTSPDASNGTGLLAECPRAPVSRTNTTGAHTSTPYTTVDTPSRELPYRVTARA